MAEEHKGPTNHQIALAYRVKQPRVEKTSKPEGRDAEQNERERERKKKKNNIYSKSSGSSSCLVCAMRTYRTVCCEG